MGKPMFFEKKMTCTVSTIASHKLCRRVKDIIKTSFYQQIEKHLMSNLMPSTYSLNIYFS